MRKNIFESVVNEILQEYSADQRLPFDDDQFKNKNYLEQYTDWLEDFGKYGELPPSKLDFWDEIKKNISIIKEKKIYRKYNVDLSIYSEKDIFNYFLNLFKDKLTIIDNKVYVEREIKLDKQISYFDTSDINGYDPKHLFHTLVDYYQDNVGGCWSFSKEGGKSYCSHVNGSSILLKGLIRIEDIDMITTILLNIVHQRENEIRVKPRAKIELFEVIADCKYKIPLKQHLIVNATYFGNNTTYRANYAPIENDLDNDKKYMDRNGNIYNISNLIKKTLSNGKTLNDLLYDEEIIDEIYDLNNNITCLNIDRKWFLFNKQTNTLVKNGNIWFDDIGDFIENFAPVKLNSKWSFIDSNGNLIDGGNAWFDDVTDFSNGYSQVELNNKYSFINEYGKLIGNGDEWFDDAVINVNKTYGDIIAFVKDNNKWSFICHNGKLVKNGKLWFDVLEKANNNFFYIKKDKKSYIIDTNGNFYDVETKQPIEYTNENKKHIKKIIKETINNYLKNGFMKIIIQESQLKYIVEGRYKRYYVNTKVKLPSSGRSCGKISASEFKEKMIKLWDKYIPKDSYNGKFSVDKFVYRFCRKNNEFEVLKQLNNDLSKVKFDEENLGSIGGIKTSNGITYIECYGGGDWEIPVLFYIYWDGQKFRGYIPTCGNSFNRKLKIALGNNSDDDVKFLRSEGLNGSDEELASMVNRISYDKDLCFKDFKSRIKLK